MRLSLFAALVIMFGLLPAVDTRADTGGSMGGGDWSSSGDSYSSGGSYSSSGSYSYSGGGSYSYSGDSYSYSSSGGGGGCSGDGASGNAAAGVILFLLFAVVVIALFAASQARWAPPAYAGSPAPIDSADVSVLRIAVDGRARKFVQTELARIAAGANTATAEGRRAMLREVALLLRRVRDAWVYGGAVNLPMSPLMSAKQAFDKHVDDARARFREETIRNEQGVIARREASDYTPRSDEGAGLILVTIVLAARRELYTVGRIGNGDDLRNALEAASLLSSNDLVAIEIIWQPSEDEDRLSSLELEAKYPPPELHRLQGALVGKTFCAYCAGPFPAELVSCPHCGAPSRGRAA